MNIASVNGVNIDQVIRFELDGEVLERRLVARPVEDESAELNAQSPVGQALLSAIAGQSIEVETPGGALMVKVLSINGRQGGVTGD
jgi:transcription elongation GreA/GreB family factor